MARELAVSAPVTTLCGGVGRKPTTRETIVPSTRSTPSKPSSPTRKQEFPAGFGHAAPGQGESITANKVNGARAIMVTSRTS